MIVGMFILIIIVISTFTLYAVLRIDQNNYTHILMAIASGAVFILAGFEILDGLTYYAGSTLSITVENSWIGMLFMALGVLMILYATVHSIDIIRTASEKL
jgi:hypothetical protein